MAGISRIIGGYMKRYWLGKWEVYQEVLGAYEEVLVKRVSGISGNTKEYMKRYWRGGWRGYQEVLAGI